MASLRCPMIGTKTASLMHAVRTVIEATGAETRKEEGMRLRMMAEVVAFPMENSDIQLHTRIDSALARPAHERKQAGDATEKEEQYAENPSEINNSDPVTQKGEEKDIPDSQPITQSNPNLSGNSADKEEEASEEVKQEAETPIIVPIPANSNIPNREQRSDSAGSSRDRKQEESKEGPETAHPVSIALQGPIGPNLNPILSRPEAQLSSKLATEEREKHNKYLKKNSKRTKFCSCFRQAEEGQDSPTTEKTKVLTTTKTKVSTKETQEISPRERQAPFNPPPNRAAPSVPAPTRPPPIIPSSSQETSVITTIAAGQNVAPSDLVRPGSRHTSGTRSQSIQNRRPSEMSAGASWDSAQADLDEFEVLFSRYTTRESGREGNRPHRVLKKEDAKVKTLQDPIYHPKYKYWKTPFRGNDLEDKRYIDWVGGLRETLRNTIESTPGLGTTSLESMRYLEYVNVRSSQLSRWKKVVLIGFETQNQVAKFNEELRNDKTDTWFLAGYEVQAEVAHNIGPCATSTTSGILGEYPIGTPIFAQNAQSVTTFCGLACHIRGSDKLSDSFCTIGGILLINKKFFALTSAHPFQDAVNSAKEINIVSEAQIGKLVSYKYGNPISNGNKSNYLVSDWALISLENEYIRPNSISLQGSKLPIPITGYLPTAEFKSEKVWICSSRGPQMGVLSRNPVVIGMGGKVFETRSIRLVNELVDGDSGSWVVRSGKLCGFVISRTFGDATQAWAYMIPIEQVFKDIYEHLESTWDGEISNPQTWLGEALPKSAPKNAPAVQLIESEIQSHKKEEVQAQQLQHGGSALPVERSTDLAAAQSEILLVSNRSHLGEPVTADHQSDADHDPDPEQASIKETISHDQEEPQVEAELPTSAPRRLYDLTVSKEVIPEPVLSHADISIDPLPNADPIGITSVNLGPATQITNDEIIVIREGQEKEDEEKEEDEKEGGEKEEDVKEKDEKKAAQKNGGQKKEDQKDGQKKDLTAQQKGKEKEEHDTEQGERSENQEHPQRELPIKTEALSIRSAADWIDYHADLSRFVDPRHPPNEIPSVIEAISRLWRSGDVGTKKITRDVMFEVVVFNDLMSQLTHAVTPTDTTRPKDEQRAEWWEYRMWLENVVSSLGDAKTGLILEILSREVKLIRRIVSIKKIIPLPFDVILAWQTIREIRSNNSRLKILIERLPPIPSYQQEPDHQELDHLLTVEQIPVTTTDIFYDCTKYLELYKVLMRQGLFNLVGLSVPEIWARGKSDHYTQEPFFVFLESYDNKPVEADNIFDTARLFIPAQWWRMVSVDEEDIRPPEIGFREMDDGFFKCEAFLTSLKRIDGSSRPVTFNPVPLRHSPSYSFVSFRGMFGSGRVSRIPDQEFFKMALFLSVGMIFLSPTPWYPDNSSHLWNQILFYLDTNHRLVDVIFAVDLSPRGARRVSQGKRIILTLGIALIELALRKEIDGDPEGYLRSGFVALEMGVRYQNIVKTCLSGKYETSSRIQVIDEDLASFQERANEAIIMPLRALWLETEMPKPTMSGGR